MRDEYLGDKAPSFDDDFDLLAVLDYPRLVLAASAPGGLARLMRVVEAVQED
jgi:hypothetical protein